MDDQKNKLTQIQEYLYQGRESESNQSINNNNNNNVAPPAKIQEKVQTKNQKDLSNEILYFSINQDSK